MESMLEGVRWRENLRYLVDAVRTTMMMSIRNCMIGKTRREWRTYLAEKWGQYPAAYRTTKPSICIFINAGEILGITVFCKTLRQRYPTHQLIIAVDNRDAYHIGKELKIADALIYSPWDFAWVGKKMLRRFPITTAVFISKVFHPVIAKEWRRQGCCVGMVAGHFSPEIHLLPENVKVWRRLFANHAYRELDFLSMQDEGQKKELLKYTEYADINVLGNIREDVSHAAVTMAEKQQFSAMLRIAPHDRLVIAAATREDEGIILDAWTILRKQFPGLKLLLVPRYSEHAAKIAACATQKGIRTSRLSTLGRRPEPLIIADARIKLAKMYGIADVIVFARTFNPMGGWANILEPAFHGKPIVFGKNLKLWPAGLRELVARYPVVQAHDAEGLASAVLHFLKDRPAAHAVGKAFQQLTEGGERIAIANAKFVYAQWKAKQREGHA